MEYESSAPSGVIGEEGSVGYSGPNRRESAINALTAPPGHSGGGDWVDNLGGISALLAPPMMPADSGSKISEVGPGQPTEGPAAAKIEGKSTEQAYKGPVAPETVENRAKAYVKKQKEKQIEELKKSLV